MEPKKHGFKTPDKYFEEFEDRLFEKLDASVIPDEHGLKVPENYFDGLEDSILERIKEEEKQTKVVPLFGWKTLTYAASIAACAVLIFTVFNTNSSSKQLDNLEIASIEKYFEEEPIEMNTYEVAALLNDEELTQITNEEEYFSEENIEEYLLENIDDTTLLIE